MDSIRTVLFNCWDTREMFSGGDGGISAVITDKKREGGGESVCERKTVAYIERKHEEWVYSDCSKTFHPWYKRVVYILG